MYCVYWIRKENDLDIMSTGYVGITKDFTERMRAHKKNKKKSPLIDAIKAYGWHNLKATVVKDNLTLEEALKEERYYRPSINIGWNLQQGGNLGVEPSWYDEETNRAKHSKATAIATKRAIKEKDTTEARSARAKASWKKTRAKRVEAVTGENNPRALLTAEQVSRIKYVYIPAEYSNKQIAELYNVKPYVISFIRTGKNWSHI